ncbi:type II secretion system F family protein [Bordetella pseudohinzii]|uniref:Flp pilus assembly protein TadB n=2 Tax=Bordetella pseudohinzii TaxID=1331258 RepID=A0A0J6BZY8_9BORD|nr:type II secretion system F family protein [Bordetella pseudohinzii]ANY15265.1 type II secretion protein F [Bordetella pseudohinzii]KMM24338.1 type II secretion protein F [Bordetella pseudohinzii]KXA77819.1 type II secretion protein F [Bordetella pseudohinzii]KXA79537.1 type II secretion protein F [Bordetella pseudohinzii]CUI49191.1 Flp pilus assembly protein TadB [Bordetella pseudohinzii]
MEAMLNDSGARWFLISAVIAMMIGCLIVSVAVFVRIGRADRNRAVVDRALAARDGVAPPAPHIPKGARQRAAAVTEAASSAGLKLGRGRLGESLLAAEDRRLAELCFLEQSGRAKGLFIIARAVLALLLPLLAWLSLDDLLGGRGFLVWFITVFLGFALGWMLPKWWLMRRWRQRRKAAGSELPLLIDLMRLLQGVGLSVDQSIHVLVSDFRTVMPVLASELRYSADLYTRGRSREQSLGRLAVDYENDDLTAICRLIVQVDKHGGAVQEPLARFSERVRDRRKLDLKAHVARLTVKMTGVMVLTLLPALLIVTGGAGFLAVIRGLSRINGG